MSGIAAEPLAIVWEGSFATTHSFTLTNRALCQRLIQRGHRLSLLPAGLGESDATTLADYPTLAEHVRRSLPGDTLHVSHRWPPRLEPPTTGRWVLMQPWEFGSLPHPWLTAMTQNANAVWVYSRYLRDCYQRSGVPAGPALHRPPIFFPTC